MVPSSFSLYKNMIDQISIFAKKTAMITVLPRYTAPRFTATPAYRHPNGQNGFLAMLITLIYCHPRCPPTAIGVSGTNLTSPLYILPSSPDKAQDDYIIAIYAGHASSSVVIPVCIKLKQAVNENTKMKQPVFKNTLTMVCLLLYVNCYTNIFEQLLYNKSGLFGAP